MEFGAGGAVGCWEIRKARLLAGVGIGTLALAMSAGSATAQQWTGTTSNDWTVGTNWVGGSVPVAGTVIIDTTSPNPTVLGVDGAAVGTTGSLYVGDTPGSVANLTIQNGSTLTSNGAEIHIGDGAASNGTITVTGAGSQWLVSGGSIEVGAGGTGVLNIQNGATVVTQTGVTFGTFPGGDGTVNISGGSTLETNRLSRTNAGDGQVNFDDAILRARANNNFFIAGFSLGNLNIEAGGLTVDTQAFTVAAGSGFSGVGGLTKVGTGTLNLRAINTYTGETVIQAGTLALASNGSIATSSRVVANGTFSISGITATGSSIQSLAGSGSVALGAKNLTITDAKEDVFSGIIAGSGGLTLTGGTQTLSGANIYTGATNVNGGTLRAGAANIFGTTSGFSVGASGTFDLAGFDQTLASLDNAGAVRLGGAPGTTLTVTGNYVGNGGVVELNAALGDDSSMTDLLWVQGSTSGSSSLIVNNVGGVGAQTVDGIKVIDVGGASDGTFSLLGDYIFQGDQAVVGGAFAYRLYQGTPTDADGDWYLRSELDNSLLYQAGVPVYEAYPGVLQSFNQLGTLQQRLGNRSWTVVAQGADAISEEASITPGIGIWGQIEGGYGEFDPETSTTATDYDVAIWKLKAGADTVLAENSGGQLIGGVALHYGTASSDISSIFGDGSIDATGYGASASLTWYGNTGFYADAQAQVTGYDSDLHSDTAGVGLVEGNDGLGYALGIELGQRIPIAPEWALTPQAQLAWSSVEFDDFEDAFGAEVSLNSGDSLIGRLGLAVDRQTEWQAADGSASRSHVYGIGNLYYDFEDGTSVDVAGTPVDSEIEALWGGLGLGGTYAWADAKYALYGEALAKSQFEDFGDSYAISGTVGFKMTW